MIGFASPARAASINLTADMAFEDAITPGTVIVTAPPFLTRSSVLGPFHIEDTPEIFGFKKQSPVTFLLNDYTLRENIFTLRTQCNSKIAINNTCEILSILGQGKESMLIGISMLLPDDFENDDPYSSYTMSILYP